MTIDPEHIVEVLNQYNGDTHVVLPELDSQEKPAVANLLVLGLDGFAQRGGINPPPCPLHNPKD